jgi:hypothetical protein
MDLLLRSRQKVKLWTAVGGRETCRMIGQIFLNDPRTITQPQN